MRIIEREPATEPNTPYICEIRRDGFLHVGWTGPDRTELRVYRSVLVDDSWGPYAPVLELIKDMTLTAHGVGDDPEMFFAKAELLVYRK